MASSDPQGRLLHDQSKSCGVGVVLVSGNEEVLRTRGLESDEQTRFISAHRQTMGNILGKRGVRAGLHLDPLVSDESGDRAVQDVDGLVLTRVDVDRRVVAGPHAPFNDRPVATRLLAGKLELGGRAMAVSNGAARFRTGQNGVAQGHVTFLSILRLSEPTVCLSRPLRPPTPVEVNLPSRLACVDTGRCKGCARATTPPR